MDAGPSDSVYFINHNTSDAGRSTDIDLERGQKPVPHIQPPHHVNAFGTTPTYMVKRTHHKNKSIKNVSNDQSYRNGFVPNQHNRSQYGFDADTAIFSSTGYPGPLPANNDSRQQNCLEPKMKLELRKDITRGADYK
jgi:hypothetical protein